MQSGTVMVPYLVSEAGSSRASVVSIAEVIKVHDGRLIRVNLRRRAG